jgi:hypothetical protein
MSALWARITDEPVLATTLVGAVIVLAVSFGAPISDDQKLAIIGLVTAGLAIFARNRVTPV